MGDHPISPRLAAAGWTVTAAVGGLGLIYLIGTVLTATGAFLEQERTDPGPANSQHLPCTACAQRAGA